MRGFLPPAAAHGHRARLEYFDGECRVLILTLERQPNSGFSGAK